MEIKIWTSDYENRNKRLHALIYSKEKRERSSILRVWWERKKERDEKRTCVCVCDRKKIKLRTFAEFIFVSGKFIEKNLIFEEIFWPKLKNQLKCKFRFFNHRIVVDISENNILLIQKSKIYEPHFLLSHSQKKAISI